MLRKLDIEGNPYLGVLCAASDDLLVMSPGLPRKSVHAVEEALDVRAVETTLGGATVVGSLLALNATGAVVTGFLTKEERDVFDDRSILALPHRLNAAGNNILCNDKGALVHPGYDATTVRKISEFLSVPAERGTLAKLRTVGSGAVATNKGVLVHPHASEEEIERATEVLGVPGAIGTANYGTAQIGACLVANNKGCVAGSRTTPIEMGRIEEGLGYY